MSTKQDGDWGEALVEKYLSERGCRIVEREWRCRFGEIDLIAEKDGVANIYTVTTPKARLSFHDVFRRLSDGQCFRVTSNSDDGATPSMVTFSFGQCSAEEWEVPDAQR